jgi:hypothetical protein
MFGVMDLKLGLVFPMAGCSCVGKGTLNWLFLYLIIKKGCPVIGQPLVLYLVSNIPKGHARS